MPKETSTPTVVSAYGVPSIEGYKLMKIGKSYNNQDISPILDQLQSITIPSSIGPLTFNIISKTNYPDYYLYYVSVVTTGDAGNVAFDGSAGVTIVPGVLGFLGSDNDTTYGLVDFPQFSRKYMDVDYGWGGGVSTPDNFDLIINGIADRAPIQDSNYDSKSWTNIRYNGSRISSAKFNEGFPPNIPAPKSPVIVEPPVVTTTPSWPSTLAEIDSGITA